ncbi:MAG: glycosyltransferase family 2 protein, partial [Pseudomonadota bacterium]
MRIELITMWYNEEFLAPFFLNHYGWVDKIHILLDADTDDNTQAIATGYPNVSIEHFKFPDMMDDVIKARKINEKYRSITDADYVVVVDSDEFIFCNILDDSIKEHIEGKEKDFYFATLWQIYQHESDSRLDATKPVYRQRRNGDPIIANCYVKPVVVRAGLDVVWGPGNHTLVFDRKPMGWLTPNVDIMAGYNVSVYPDDMLQGAHWKLFDLEETITRRIRNRTNRQSDLHLASDLTTHHHKTCVDDIVEEYNRMKSSPIVIKDRKCTENVKLECSSIFENILAESSFAEDYEANRYDNGVDHLFESC